MTLVGQTGVLVPATVMRHDAGFDSLWLQQRQLAAATTMTRDAQQVSQQRLLTVNAKGEELAQCQERACAAEAALKSAADSAAGLTAQLASREELLAQQRDGLNKALSRNMSLSETSAQMFQAIIT